MKSVPFTIRGVRTWFIDLEGILGVEGNELRFEFRARHAILRYIKSSPKEVRIPIAEVEEARFRGGLVRGELILRSRRLTTFSPLQKQGRNELRLRCRREDWELARELASRLSMLTTQEELKTLIAATELAELSKRLPPNQL